MIEALIYLLVYIVVAGLLWWAVTTVLDVLPLPDPFKTIARVILIVILCLILIFALLQLVPGSLPRLR